MLIVIGLLVRFTARIVSESSPPTTTGLGKAVSEGAAHTGVMVACNGTVRVWVEPAFPQRIISVSRRVVPAGATPQNRMPHGVGTRVGISNSPPRRLSNVTPSKLHEEGVLLAADASETVTVMVVCEALVKVIASLMQLVRGMSE